MHAIGEEEPAALGENARYRTGFLAFQRWSPLAVPLGLGAGMLALTCWLTAHGLAQPYTPAWELGPVALVVLAVIGGMLLGALLAVAPTDALWLGAVVAGGVIYVAALLCAVLGLLAGILPVAVVAAAGFCYARTHRLGVAEGTIILTERKGSYLRTLYPGTNLLWPGEHPLGTLDTGQRVYICPTQQGQVRAPDGMPLRASASAIVGFAVIPDEVHSAARSLATWEQNLHQLIAVALREALQQWSAYEVTMGGQAPAGLVARWTLDELRGWARSSGVWVAWVRVCHLQLDQASDDHHAAAPALVSAAYPRMRSGTGFAERATPPPPSVSFAVPAGRTQPSANLPAMREVAHSASMPPQAPQSSPRSSPGALTHGDRQEWQRSGDLEHLTPEALADLYEAVREGHINTPQTVRDIAHAFARLPQEVPGEVELPYDPAAAADALLRFAAQLERYNASIASAARPSHGTAVYGPTLELMLNGTNQ